MLIILKYNGNARVEFPREISNLNVEGNQIRNDEEEAIRVPMDT